MDQREVLSIAREYPFILPKQPTRDSMTDEQFNAIMTEGYEQAKAGKGLPVDEAFARIRKGV